MEAENSRLAHQGLHHHHHQHEHHHHIQQNHHQLSLSNTGIPGLDVVRALHQTVISLRSALESSREELHKLRKIVKDYKGETYSEIVERLSLENHVLRRKIIRRGDNITDGACIISPEQNLDSTTSKVSIPVMSVDASTSKDKHQQQDHNTMENTEINNDDDIKVTHEESAVILELSTADVQQVLTNNNNNNNNDDDNNNKCEILNIEQQINEDSSSSLIQDVESPEQECAGIIYQNNIDDNLKNITDIRYNNNPSPGCTNDRNICTGESENDSEELDDIELIFTTDENCREISMQEVLVSITEPENWQQPTKKIVLQTSQEQDETIAHDIDLECDDDDDDDDADNNNDDEGDDDEDDDNNDQTNNITTKTSSVDEAGSSQYSSVDRGENADHFDSVSNPRLQKIWSQCSVLVETDISKCGVLDQIDHHHYHHHHHHHPIVHNAERRNTVAGPSTSYRPIIHRETQGNYGRRKSLIPLRPMMDNCANGARRENGVQTDISALPSHWKSESYLAHKVAHTFTTLPSKFSLPINSANRLKLSDKTREARRVMLSDISFTSMVPELSRSADHLTLDLKCQQTPEWHRPDCPITTGNQWPKSNMRLGLHSPCECRVSTEIFSSRFRSSLASIPSPVYEVGGSPPPRRQTWRTTNPSSFETWKHGSNMPSTSRLTWSSVPSSPTHICPFSSNKKFTKNPLTKSRQKVTFQEGPMIRGSMPNLPSEINCSETSDSTESLIDEAEAYLRRGIDSILKISSPDRDCLSGISTRRRRSRRNSETDLTRKDFLPKNARPFLPKHPRDLKLDNLVKVISPEGKVLQGKVRYVGPLPGTEDIHVGVELPTDTGTTDGTFHGRRFFNCEQDCGVFVPFKKVILAWCTI